MDLLEDPSISSLTYVVCHDLNEELACLDASSVHSQINMRKNDKAADAA